MKTSQTILVLSFTTLLLTQQGCYTQVTTQRIVQAQHRPVIQHEVDREADSTTSDSIVYVDPELVEYHYHFYDYDNSCFGGRPNYNSQDLYVNVHFNYGHHWMWRPYPRYRYWQYTHSYYWNYPYYNSWCYDPYYYHYDPWDYYAYYPLYYNSPRHYYNQPDYEKRDWDRRSEPLTKRTVNRSSDRRGDVHENSSRNTFTTSRRTPRSSSSEPRKVVRTNNEQGDKQKNDRKTSRSAKQRSKVKKRSQNSRREFIRYIQNDPPKKLQKKTSKKRSGSAVSRNKGFNTAVAIITTLADGSKSSKKSSGYKRSKSRKSSEGKTKKSSKRSSRSSRRSTRR